MKYLFIDLSHLASDSGMHLDGLLGYPFFSKARMSINYKLRKIYIWEWPSSSSSQL